MRICWCETRECGETAIISNSRLLPHLDIPNSSAENLRATSPIFFPLPPNPPASGSVQRTPSERGEKLPPPFPLSYLSPLERFASPTTRLTLPPNPLARFNNKDGSLNSERGRKRRKPPGTLNQRAESARDFRFLGECGFLEAI